MAREELDLERTLAALSSFVTGLDHGCLPVAREMYKYGQRPYT